MPKRVVAGTSAAVSTSTRPGRRATQAARSPSAKRRVACGERTTRIAAAHRPGQPSAPNRSAAGRPWPAVEPGRRARRRRVPLAGGAAIGAPRLPRRAAARPRRSCGSRCSGTARRRAHLAPRSRVGRGIARSSALGRHQHARRADAALRRAVREEGAPAARDSVPSRRPGLRPSSPRGPSHWPIGDEAGADLLAVEQHRAGAAVAGIAADLGAGQAELVAQHVGEAPRRRPPTEPAAPLTVKPTSRRASRLMPRGLPTALERPRRRRSARARASRAASRR